MLYAFSSAGRSALRGSPLSESERSAPLYRGMQRKLHFTLVLYTKGRKNAFCTAMDNADYELPFGGRTGGDSLGGVVMNLSVQTFVFLVVLANAVCGAGIGFSQPPAGDFLAAIGNPAAFDRATPDVQDEKLTVEALAKLGVPLGYDPGGRVRWIEAAGGELSDEALRALPGLPVLEWLEVGSGKITAAGLAHLKDCSALRRLYIHDVSLGTDSLSWLAALRLEALSLQRTGLVGASLKQLKSTGTLTVLNLSGNQITDEDLSVVAQYKNLEVLALQDTRITGNGLARLKDMARLNVVNVVNCRIVDADLKHLLTLTNLRILQAAGCNLGDKAVKELTDKLPMLAVFR